VGNTFSAGRNVRYFTPKRIVTVTAKSAGNALIEDHRKSLQEHSRIPGAGPSSEGD
jgi:hypothetical protein